MIRSVVAALLGCVAFVALILFFAGEIYDYQDSFDGADLPDVDAIVCLAGGRGRLALAGDLWYRYWEKAHSEESASLKRQVPVLYFSGTGKKMQWTDLSKQIRRGVVEAIHPQEDIIIEDESSNTEGNAFWFVRHARDRNWKKILLVTSSYHMKRARLIFELTLKHQGLPIRVDTVSVFQEPFEPGDWVLSLHGARVTLNEYLKFLWYRMSAGSL